MNKVSRQLGRAAFAWPFDARAIAPSTPRHAVEDAIAELRGAMVPNRDRSMVEQRAAHQEIGKVMRSIGLRIRPDFSPDQAKMWIASMVEALDQLPPRIAVAATRDARDHPISFPGDVLGVILERAKHHGLAYERAQRNLAAVLREIDAPARLESSPEAAAAAAQLSIDEMQDLPASLRSLGLSAGWIVAEPDGSIRWASDEEQQAHQTAREQASAARRERPRT